ncbi:DUF3187 family protein [Geomonas paludis]|uniref:DUF3187 family protein n=1 Tax=Geomonas paludis TaxID=2740185 RepID=A0A6V8MV15_9BACT|nr:DUF3187 family protein [Geomonas paludis]UPU37396.1 DUF3187 family protein [Geomonas paludis]GFO64035.1 hypothetical protein GMPD_19540 [Geomonas paludis]
MLLLAVWGRPCQAEPLAITPFYTFNQSPLVQIYGLPAAESAVVQRTGKAWTLVAVDVANSYLKRETARETLLVDGEGERITLALRYGVGQGGEVGMDLPLVAYNGGIFDGFIEDWHEFFGLPQGQRPDAPKGQLRFAYARDGQQRLEMDRDGLGIGDVRFNGAWQLYRDGGVNPVAVALRGSLKLPTGSSSRLTGSGSTDLALWLTGSSDYALPGRWGHATVFAAAGGLAMTDGQVLKDQHNNLAGFGTLGLGWAPADGFALKAQLSGHSAFFRDSAFSELSSGAMQVIFGGTVAFSPRTTLDIALSEDVTVGASPDVALHLGVGHQF